MNEALEVALVNLEETVLNLTKARDAHRKAMQAVGYQMRVIRHQCNMRPKQVAKKAGIKSETYCAIESGKFNPNQTHLIWTCLAAMKK